MGTGRFQENTEARYTALVIGGLLVLALVTRLAAVPASIWDQDEAYFAAAVLRFDPLHDRPHPPFFPLWVAIGKVVHLVVPTSPPETGLMMASLVAGIALPVLLWLLWSKAMDPLTAAAAAVLFTVLPAPWLLAARAYTGTAATSWLTLGTLLVLDGTAGWPRLLAGSVALAFSFLIRPQWIPMVAVLCIWAAATYRGARRLVPGAVALALGSVALALMAWSTGGIQGLLKAARAHGLQQFGTLSRFTFSYPELGLNRALGGPAWGTIWCVLAVAGIVRLMRRRNRPAGRRILWLLLLPQLLLYVLAENPTLPRYALPVLAFSVGAVLEGLGALLGGSRRATAFALVTALVAGVVVAPHLEEYRRRPSPVVRLMTHLCDPAAPRYIVVADHGLVSFIQLQRLEGRWRHRLLWDYAVRGGVFRSGQRPDLVAIWDGPRPSYVRGGTLRRFACNDPFLASVASPRFVRLSLCRGCGVGPGGPKPPLRGAGPGAGAHGNTLRSAGS